MRGHFSGWRRVVDCGPLGGREEDMKKALCKWAALCLAAAMLGGCGSDGTGNGLEDMGVSPVSYTHLTLPTICSV